MVPSWQTSSDRPLREAVDQVLAENPRRFMPTMLKPDEPWPGRPSPSRRG